jgi:hypothetical protein
MVDSNDDASAEIAKFEALADKAFFEMHKARSPRGVVTPI